MTSLGSILIDSRRPRRETTGTVDSKPNQFRLVSKEDGARLKSSDDETLLHDSSDRWEPHDLGDQRRERKKKFLGASWSQGNDVINGNWCYLTMLR